MPVDAELLRRLVDVREDRRAVRERLRVPVEADDPRVRERTQHALGVAAHAEGRVDEHRAKLEGVAFCERLALERLATLGAVAEGPVRTAGGGARSEEWCRIRASVLDRPVLRVLGAGTALGAALLAATGSLHPDLSTAAAAMVPGGELLEPDQAEVGRLHSGYERFTAELRDRGWL